MTPAPTRLMKEIDYGVRYEYDDNAPDVFSGQDGFPMGMERPRLDTPACVVVSVRLSVGAMMAALSAVRALAV